MNLILSGIFGKREEEGEREDKTSLAFIGKVHFVLVSEIHRYTASVDSSDISCSDNLTSTKRIRCFDLISLVSFIVMILFPTKTDFVNDAVNETISVSLL